MNGGNSHPSMKTRIGPTACPIVERDTVIRFSRRNLLREMHLPGTGGREGLRQVANAGSNPLKLRSLRQIAGLYVYFSQTSLSTMSARLLQLLGKTLEDCRVAA